MKIRHIKVYFMGFFRFSKYRQMITDSVTTPEELPPSEQAACYQGFHVHLQMIQWKMLDEMQSLNPSDWA